MREHTDKAKEQDSWVVVMLVLLVVIVIYFLSFGPVCAATYKLGAGDAGTDVLKIVYAPIVWLHDNTFLKEPLERYLAWWFVVFGMKPFAP